MNVHLGGGQGQVSGTPHSRAHPTAAPGLTFSPVRVTMSRGPYIKRPINTCGPSSLASASLTRWLAVTFWGGGGEQAVWAWGNRPPAPPRCGCRGSGGAGPTEAGLTLSFTWVRLRCHFSLGFEGLNTDTSLPSRSRMLELSWRMTWGQHGRVLSLGGGAHSNLPLDPTSLFSPTLLMAPCHCPKNLWLSLYRAQAPVSAGRRPRRWTPSSWRGRGEAAPRWERPSGRPGSTGHSRCASDPTTWQQLQGGRQGGPWKVTGGHPSSIGVTPPDPSWHPIIPTASSDA